MNRALAYAASPLCLQASALQDPASMASPPASQVSLDDILEYTSNNELLSPEEQAQQLREPEEPIPADLADQLFTARLS